MKVHENVAVNGSIFKFGAAHGANDGDTIKFSDGTKEAIAIVEEVLSENELVAVKTHKEEHEFTNVTVILFPKN